MRQVGIGLSERTGKNFLGQLYQFGTVRSGTNCCPWSIFFTPKTGSGAQQEAAAEPKPNNRSTILHSRARTAVGETAVQAVRRTMRNSGPLKEWSGLRRLESGRFVPQIRYPKWSACTSGYAKPSYSRRYVAGAIGTNSGSRSLGRQKCSKHGSSSIRNGER